MADNDAHIAEVVAGENKVYVDTGIFPTAERRHMADRVQGNEAEREGKNNFDDHTYRNYKKCRYGIIEKQKLLQGGEWIVRSSNMR